jgi:glycosyltransferase involved in cell wall biosynthesis
MKVAVYAIAKNEEHNVKRWLASVKDADGIFVLDTGSSDRTVELLREGGAHVSIWPVHKEFRFDSARNAAMDLIPEDYDLCVSLDFDEVILAGWREQLNSFTGDGANYTLIYSFDNSGIVTCSYPRFAIHKRRPFYWTYPAHEVLVPAREGFDIDHNLQIAVVHLPSQPKPPGHYLNLLRIGYNENPNDPRTLQYFARELMYCGQNAFAQDIFLKHVEVEQHPQFRSESFRFIAGIASKTNELEKCERMLFRAIYEFPDAREPYCELAFLYFETGEYEQCIGMLRGALRITSKPEVPMIFKNEYYGYWPYHLLAVAYMRMGLNKTGEENLQLAVQQCNGELPDALLQDVLKVGLHVRRTSAGSGQEQEVEQKGISGSVEEGATLLSGTVPEIESPVPAGESGEQPEKEG